MLMLIWIEFIKRENKHKNKNIRTEELSCKNRNEWNGGDEDSFYNGLKRTNCTLYTVRAIDKSI